MPSVTTRSDSSGAGAAGAVTAVPAAFAPLGELGRGAHTVVYKVRRTRDGAEYALKLLESSGPAGDGRSAAGFRREAALLACLDHPALARVHEVGESRGQPYLVMDYVDGRRLTEVLDAGPLAERRLVALGLDLAGALVAAHRAGVVHRDVKPDNILLLADGRAKLIDFGLAARAGAGQVEGAAAGTFLYSAPEQTGMLRRPVDGRADLYALGVVLFECATGEPPFSHPEVGELLRLHAAAPRPTLGPCGRSCRTGWPRSSAGCWPRIPTTATRTARSCWRTWVLWPTLRGGRATRSLPARGRWSAGSGNCASWSAPGRARGPGAAASP
jgi:serine/threonine protein kinase